jgi:L-serine dehydratase
MPEQAEEDPASRRLVGVFEIFQRGIGPSSSHAVGPMRAAGIVLGTIGNGSIAQLDVTLYGSLALTGQAHGTDRALVAGFLGARPETVEPEFVLDLDGSPEYVRLPSGSVAYHLRKVTAGGPPGHPNAMQFVGTDALGVERFKRTFRSIGGGFLTEDGVQPSQSRSLAPYPYSTAAELVSHAEDLGCVSAVASANESASIPAHQVTRQLLEIRSAMYDCIDRGLRSEQEYLPGALHVPRRAPSLWRAQIGQGETSLAALEWVSLWAIAVNEENAACGRIVTAPTNGAAGVIPAVMRYAEEYESANETEICRLLLVGAAVGALIKRNASISGAEVGCQGEVGSASAMAAAGLAEILGGTPSQVANAAEIALEHHLGMTCDPVGGLVQVPCIERNAIGAAKAITAAKLALRGDGTHVVSLDQAIETMRRTGRDMSGKYKETSLGGLAVSIADC